MSSAKDWGLEDLDSVLNLTMDLQCDFWQLNLCVSVSFSHLLSLLSISTAICLYSAYNKGGGNLDCDSNNSDNK